VLILVASCTGGPSPTASPLPIPSLFRDGPTETLANGLHRFWPESGPIEHGRPYRYQLYTHCWVPMLIDVDGSLWDVATVTDHDGKPPLDYGNSYDPSTFEISLADPAVATFRSDRGDMTLELRRLPDSIDLQICA
jgi:hypothetical protein